MERERLQRKPDFEYKSTPDERVDPALVCLIIRTQINEVITRYEHDRFVEIMNI